MGLTNASTGKNAAAEPSAITKRQNEKIIALAGNPNVGKSTVFNNLTGMNQHTGNWTGKTVAVATGRYQKEGKNFLFVDIPGTYSLFPNSPEEEVAKDFILFGNHDGTVIVCDATCLERNLSLVLQILEATGNCAVCVNLMDEAKRKNISVDINALEDILGVPVVGTTARKKSDTEKIISAIENIKNNGTFKIDYTEPVENALSLLIPAVKLKYHGRLNPRFVALELLEKDGKTSFEGIDLTYDDEIINTLNSAKSLLPRNFREILTGSRMKLCENIAKKTVGGKFRERMDRDIKADEIFTGRKFGYPIMIAFLLLVLWLTVEGANYPSAALSALSLKLQAFADAFLVSINTPALLREIIVDGVLRVLCTVVSVMLPPMAIFFPFFTLLEDLGYLPRIAYNLDKPFKCCGGCGKQALTMCMGFGCNAAGVTGCRIINSERERLAAIITNSLVPCNGRFPLLITLISLFFVCGRMSGFVSALFLTGFILLSVAMTFLITKLLSVTLLKGEKSAFVLELPPYRKPQMGKILVRSLLDRTLFVLGRAVAVAVPAGLVIWIMANVNIGDVSLLSHFSAFLDPLGKFLGMDGVILVAFILGFPANEIVLPIIIMAYGLSGSITDVGDAFAIKQILAENGWTEVTAICTMLFSMFHFPCSTTLITIKKETGSMKWTIVSALLPTLVGMIICAVINALAKI